MRLRTVRTIMRIVLLILIVYAFLTLLSVGERLTAAQSALESIRERSAALQRQNQALRSSIDSETERDTMERLARESLRLTRPEEAETYQAGD